MKEIWDAAHKYHSKKNDRSKIAQLVAQAGALQQGEKFVLKYANDLDHYRPFVSL